MSKPQSPSRLEKIRSLANSILNYVDQCEERISTGSSTSEQDQKIYTTCTELASFAVSPRNWVIGVACSYAQSMALSLVLEMKLQNYISNTETATPLDDIVHKAGASKEIIKMALRHCVGYHIFEEPTPENYRHNENSRMLLNENYASWVHFRVDEGFRAGAQLSQSIVANKFQIPEEPEKRAFGMAFQTSECFYEYYNREDRARGARFGKAMMGSTETAIYGRLPVELVSSFKKLKKTATVVDVGGGRGQNPIRLARHFEEMSFIVQDRYTDADAANWSHLPKNLRDRIKWQVHDFCTPQSVKGADMYMISQVLMDHQFSVCQDILKHIVEAMAPNRSILLISDYISPTDGEGSMALATNALNLHMLAILGRAFWTQREWQDFFTSVSPSLRIQKLEMLEGRVIFQLVKKG